MRLASTIRIPLIAAAAVLDWSAIRSAANTYDLANGSSLTLHGTSTVNTWTFISTSVKGHTTVPVDVAVIETVYSQLATGGAPDLAAAKRREKPGVTWEGHLMVPVSTLSSDNPRQDRDMQKALKVATHPNVHCHLTNIASVLVSDLASNQFLIATSGTITIGGQSRPVDIGFTADREAPGDYRIRGEQHIRMSDFGITPPSALLGLIRAHDDVRIAFDLHVKPGIKTP